jgi:PPOX class probable F420-dependent enzyme
MTIEIKPEVEKRLENEQVIWLTTTKADGTPLPNPVWFLWHNGQFLVFTLSESVKMKNMARNPRVALNLNSDFDATDVVIFQAEADTNGEQASEEEFNAYVAKYEEGLKQFGLSNDELKATYRLVRLKPTKFRTVAAG